jgi:predicted nucleic acid-binding protein
VSLVILLDTGVLGLLTNRRSRPDALTCRRWAATHHQLGNTIIVPEIADYELRRELVRTGATAGLRDLDALAGRFRYAPLTTADLRLAAELWARARNAGMPTADPHALDGDVILAAQARLLEPDPGRLVVATTNVGHLARFVPAASWPDITP